MVCRSTGTVRAVAVLTRRRVGWLAQPRQPLTSTVFRWTLGRSPVASGWSWRTDATGSTDLTTARCRCSSFDEQRNEMLVSTAVTWPAPPLDTNTWFSMSPVCVRFTRFITFYNVVCTCSEAYFITYFFVSTLSAVLWPPTVSLHSRVTIETCLECSTLNTKSLHSWNRHFWLMSGV